VRSAACCGEAEVEEERWRSVRMATSVGWEVRVASKGLGEEEEEEVAEEELRRER
jgi:hypothetical protein